MIRYGTMPTDGAVPVDPDKAVAAVKVQWVEVVGRDGEVVRLDVGNFSIKGVRSKATSGHALASIDLLGPAVPVFCDFYGNPLVRPNQDETEDAPILQDPE